MNDDAAKGRKTGREMERARILDALRGLKPDREMLRAVAQEGSSPTTYREAFGDAITMAVAAVEETLDTEAGAAR